MKKHRNNRLFAVALTLAMALAHVGQVHAQQETQTQEAFTQERFEALQSEGALILIDVFADWCPTCARQQKILSEFREANPDLPFHSLTVDFDNQKKWVREFKAPRQSTLILYHGDERLWFSVAETDPEVISEAILKAAK